MRTQLCLEGLHEGAEAANSEELTAAFESHLAETENQSTRLKQVFTSLDELVKSKECKAMKGLLEEGAWTEGGTTKREDIVVYEVMANSTERDWWKRYRRKLEKRFRQQTVVIRAQTIQRL
ncbi:MAG: DUF892 family protein [Verrucomicrobia bacterium]|nr:DUF892 family protein [Verrucomicrobiota bacterium]